MFMPYYFTKVNEIFLAICMMLIFLPFLLQLFVIIVFKSVEFITNTTHTHTNKNKIKVY